MNISSNTPDLSKNHQTMSSREIAELVESRHDSVKRAMDRLHEKGLIAITPLVEPQERGGKPTTLYHVNKRDSYVVVAQLSPEFTARLVDRWQELESKLPQLPDFSNPVEAARAWADAKESEQQAKQELALAAPKVDFADRIAGADKGIKIGNFAKSVGLGPRKIFSLLREHRILMTGGDRYNLPFQEFIERGYFEVKQTTYEAHDETRIGHTTLITGKGEQWLTKRFIDLGILKASAA